MPDPLAVGAELVIEGIDINRFLRRRGTSEAKPVGSRKRQARGCKKSGPHERGRKQSQPITGRHFTLQVPAQLEDAYIISLDWPWYAPFAAKHWRYRTKTKKNGA